MFIGFLIILGLILLYKYKGRLTNEEKHTKNEEKQKYILSKIKHLQEAKKIAQQELITGLPRWENEYDSINNAYMFLGGNKLLVGNAELFMPVPFMKNNDQFRLSAFMDAGNVYASNQSVNLGDLRMSAGVGAMWISPFGPIKVMYAKPFNSQTNDKTESIQFQMGQQF